MALMYVLGNQLADRPDVSAAALVGLTATSATAAAAAESVALVKPLVGASGVAMGYLSALTLLDPGKTWLMIFPIPGVPVTTLQLFQGTFAGHVGGLIYKGLFTPTNVAIRGHLGGLVAGLLYTQTLQGTTLVETFRGSRHQWERTITSAELVVYWVYLSLRLMLTMPFSSEAEIGTLRTKQRFIKRVWKEDF